MTTMAELFNKKNRLLHFAKDDFNELQKLAEKITKTEHLSENVKKLLAKIEDSSLYYNQHVK